MLRRPYLRATVFVIALGFFIQITGVNAIVYYSPRLFDAMGFRGNFALLVLPAMVQAAALAAVLISVALVDRLGRRPVLLSGIGTMIAADLVLIVVFAAHSPAVFGLLACWCSRWGSPSVSERWYGCTQVRVSRPGYVRSGRARC